MGDVSNVQMGIEGLLPKKKAELTKYGRKQAVGKLASSCVVVGWQGRSEGCVCLVGVETPRTTWWTARRARRTRAGLVLGREYK